MKHKDNPPIKRILIAGGGTGGHIFPAIALADAFKSKMPDIDIVFVGAVGGMELDLVPKAGYKIEPVWISGLYRKLNLKNIRRNLLLPLKYLVSMMQAKNIIKHFQPQIAIGVGGYAAYPAIQAAIQTKQIFTVLQEQNAIPGLVNRRLAPNVNLILAGNPALPENLKTDKNNIIYTGNPIRKSLLGRDVTLAKQQFGLAIDKPVLFVLGGSLGAQSLNQTVQKYANTLLAQGGQIIWQCGKQYYTGLQEKVNQSDGLVLLPFVEDMGAAYAAADLVLCRAGALTLSEIAALRKPAVLIPSPNVANDHQAKNAASFVQKEAAYSIADSDLSNRFCIDVLPLLFSNEKRTKLIDNLAYFQKEDAAEEMIALILQHYVQTHGNTN